MAFNAARFLLHREGLNDETIEILGVLNPDFSSLVVARRRKGRPGKACDRDHSWRAPAVVLVQYVDEAERA